MKKNVFVFYTFIFLLFSCSKGSSTSGGTTSGGGGGGTTVDCSTINAKFNADVNPIIQSSCATNSDCHGAGSINGPGALTSYAQIAANASNINLQVQAGLMPKTGTLSTTQKNIIKCWVQSGSPNN